MPPRFDKSAYERIKQQRSPQQKRAIALAEMRAGFTASSTIYAAVAYLTHLFEERPDVFEQADNITVRELLNTGIPHVSEFTQQSMAQQRTPADPFEVPQTTRFRLAATDIERIRKCILESLEKHREPRAAEEIIADAEAIYEGGQYEFRISTHKWLQHFAAWRQKEPHLFNKTYRSGSHSENSALWQLAEDGDGTSGENSDHDHDLSDDDNSEG